MNFRSPYAKLPAQDVERARNFYRDVLGFEPVPGAVKAAWIRDSEGNLISFAQLVGE